MTTPERFEAARALIDEMPPSRWRELMLAACARRCLIGLRELIDDAPTRVTDDDHYLDLWREIQALEAHTGV